MRGRGLRVTFEGGRELGAALEQLRPATQKKVQERAALKVMEPMRAAAEDAGESRPANAPDKTYRVAGGEVRVRRPGTLKVLFQKGVKLTRRQANAARKAGKDYVEVYVGSRDPVARLRELGTRHAPANPALRRAFENHGMNAIENLGGELKVEIDASVERARKIALRPKRARK